MLNYMCPHVKAYCIVTQFNWFNQKSYTVNITCTRLISRALTLTLKICMPKIACDNVISSFEDFCVVLHERDLTGAA